MTFYEALKALNEGKKIRKKWWHAGDYIWLDEKNTLKNKNGSEVSVAVDFDFMTKNEWEIYEEPVLDKEEKEYLSAVIKPFRNRVTDITKVEDNVASFYSLYSLRICVHLGFIDKYYEIYLPPFEKKSSMYKNMEVGKEYTLKELGL